MKKVSNDTLPIENPPTILVKTSTIQSVCSESQTGNKSTDVNKTVETEISEMQIFYDQSIISQNNPNIIDESSLL